MTHWGDFPDPDGQEHQAKVEAEAHWLHRRGWQDVRDFAIILVAIAVVVLIGVVIAR